MLHEILLSLSGHPSPLLRSAASTATHADKVLTPPERALLASLARLSDLHARLLAATAQAATTHPSTVCRAVAAAAASDDVVGLAAFRRKVLEVEDGVLRRDAGLVGAYDIVPLTAVVAEFAPWTRRLEWLWRMMQFVAERDCTGAALIDRLRAEMQTGYADVEMTARGLVQVAETAWLKQVSAWILYGQLPRFGAGDFFVQREGDSEDVGSPVVTSDPNPAQLRLTSDQEYACKHTLLPGFVSRNTAESMLFIGWSLYRIRSRITGGLGLRGAVHLSSQLHKISSLTYPLESATFARTIADIRLFLSRTTLQKLLPLSRVLETLQLLREFFLLGRGEFAMALTQQADEKIRGRWRRADNLAYEKREGLSTVVLKDGEVAAVLSQTWVALGSMQGRHAEEDEILESARDLLRLTLLKSTGSVPSTGARTSIAPTPFQNLLFSVPAVLTFQIPSPVDLFLDQSDLQIYTDINSYLLSIRRAHIRLTDLWKITSLRRHFPAPPQAGKRVGKAVVCRLRERHSRRENTMRSAWTTSSAAIFFLAETEAYLQTEVVAGSWDAFRRWVIEGGDEKSPDINQTKSKGRESAAPSQKVEARSVRGLEDGNGDGDDIWLAAPPSTAQTFEPANKPHHASPQPHDPQSLAVAHRTYLSALVRALLLSHRPFTEALHALLVRVDGLVALVRRLDGIWAAADLEADAGVVDAFADHGKEERDVRAQLREAERLVREGTKEVVEALRALEERGGSALLEEELNPADDGIAVNGELDGTGFVPHRVGGVDRLLMKLDFGSWFAENKRDNGGRGYDRDV